MIPGRVGRSHQELKPCSERRKDSENPPPGVFPGARSIFMVRDGDSEGERILGQTKKGVGFWSHALQFSVVAGRGFEPLTFGL